MGIKNVDMRKVFVGLTGLYDWLDLGHMGGGKDFQVLDAKDFDVLEKERKGGQAPPSIPRQPAR
jgi:hypothetical protein